MIDCPVFEILYFEKLGEKYRNLKFSDLTVK